MLDREGPLSLDVLRREVDSGELDTVVVAVPDMQGRLQGKRFTGRFFLDEVLTHGAAACSYLLAVDVDMNPVDGYDLTSWDRGYGDFVLCPDLATMRRVPWQPNTAMVLCDLEGETGDPVEPSPRHVLRRQLDRLADHGWDAMVGTELEFIVFRDSYEDASDKRYRGLVPANQYNVDYSLLGTARVEPLLRDIRNAMVAAGMRVESSKGECNLGQHEITFGYDSALTACDNHVIYKNGAKEIAAQHGHSLTFMAKYDQGAGNSCHVHLSLRAMDGTPVFAGDGSGDTEGFAQLFKHFLAGQLDALRELTLFFAPNVNSYKRYAAGSFAPTTVRWGHDNRTCALRVVGRGPTLRVENRVPGGDVNPYLAVAALIAAGLRGIEHELPLEPSFAGSAYTSDAARLPTSLREALTLWERSQVAHAAFGDEVVAHYANCARVELAAFDRAVTDWELVRGFERL